MTFPATIGLDGISSAVGFSINGTANTLSLGTSIASLGDFNGDGIDDVAIGAPQSSNNGKFRSGSVYVVFGSSSQFATSATGEMTFSFDALNGTNGFRIDGESSEDNLGYSLSSAGDLNGDNVPDILIAAPFSNPNGIRRAGSAYVIFGKITSIASHFNSSFSLASLDGANGFRIDGFSSTNYLGKSIGLAGDINGDGLNDIVLGVDNSAYIIFARTARFVGVFESSLNLSALDGLDGFRFDESNSLSCFARHVGSAGDFNFDGVDDLLVSADCASVDSLTHVGSAYVLFGKKVTVHEAFAITMETSLLDGNNGFQLDGASQSDFTGQSLSAAGDINGDGVDDFLVASYSASKSGLPSAGITYVIFGKIKNVSGVQASKMSVLDLDGINGFQIVGNASDQSGKALTAGADVNGDGISDIVIGAKANSMQKIGRTYVVFGRDTAVMGLFPATLFVSSLDGNNGFVLDGMNKDDYSGTAVALVDVDADTSADIFIGSPNAAAGGIAHVIKGRTILSNAGNIFSFPRSTFDSAETQLFVGKNMTLSSSSENVVESARIKIVSDYREKDILSLSTLPTGLSTYFNQTTGILRISGSSSINDYETALQKVVYKPHTLSERKTLFFDWVVKFPGSTFSTVQKIEVIHRAENEKPRLMRFLPSMQIKTLSENNGFEILGRTGHNGARMQLLIAPDLDGDNLSEIILSSPGEDHSASGKRGVGTISVVSSENKVIGDLFSNPLDLFRSLDGVGRSFEGLNQGGGLGSVVVGLPDHNGDGYGDIFAGERGDIVGTHQQSSGYVIFGCGAKLHCWRDLQLTDLNGMNGYKITTDKTKNELELFISATSGDINGDGLSDLILGGSERIYDPGRFDTAVAFVIFGRTANAQQTFPSEINISNLDGRDGFRLDTVSEGIQSTLHSVFAGSDVNGDGINDIFMGAKTFPSFTIEDRVYVVYGNQNITSTAMNATSSSQILGKYEGFEIHSEDFNDNFGQTIVAAGDFNVDGIDDILIGAPSKIVKDNFSAGAVYMLYGRHNFSVTLSAAELVGDDGFRLDGDSYSQWLGSVISGGADFDDDGVDDICLGVAGRDVHSKQAAGSAYILFGNSTIFSGKHNNNLTLADLNSSSAMALLGDEAFEHVGSAITLGRDINGDGVADLSVGAEGASPLGRVGAGKAYTVFGFNRPTYFEQGEAIYPLSAYYVDYLGDLLSAADITIVGNYIQGDKLSFSPQPGITGHFNEKMGTFSLNGTSTLQYYQDALRSIMFSTTHGDPGPLKTLEVTIQANTSLSESILQKINIVEKNDPPLLVLSSPLDVYTEKLLPIVLFPNVTLFDWENNLIHNATITVSNNFALGQDVLHFSSIGNIQGFYNNTGVLVLEGSDSLENYQSALQAVKFENTASNPSSLTREIALTVNDGDESIPVSKQIAVHAVNDPPVLINNQLNVDEGETLQLSNINFKATDVDSTDSSLLYTLFDINHGRFERLVSPGSAITTFSQGDIDNGAIQFVHDGSKIAPSYQFFVNDGSDLNGPNTGSASFTQATNPTAGASTSGRTIGITAGAAAGGAALLLAGLGFLAYRRRKQRFHHQLSEANQLAEQSHDASDFELAIANIDKAAKYRSNEQVQQHYSNTYKAWAAHLILQDDYEQAVNKLTEALRHNSNDTTLIRRGEAYAAWARWYASVQGDDGLATLHYDLALKDFEAAVLLNRNNAQAKSAYSRVSTERNIKRWSGNAGQQQALLPDSGLGTTELGSTIIDDGMTMATAHENQDVFRLILDEATSAGNSPSATHQNPPALTSLYEDENVLDADVIELDEVKPPSEDRTISGNVSDEDNDLTRPLDESQEAFMFRMPSFSRPSLDT